MVLCNHDTIFVFLQGVGKLADGKAFTDPEVFRRLTSSVSCALDEAAAALTRMRTQNNGMPSSSGQTTADSGLSESCMHLVEIMSFDLFSLFC